MNDGDRRYGLEDGFRDGKRGDESQVNPKKYNLDDYESGYLTGYRRGTRGDAPLFVLSVRMHDNDALDYDAEDPDDAEVATMARAAAESVWSDIWDRHEPTFRGQDVVVSVALPDGTPIHSISK